MLGHFPGNNTRTFLISEYFYTEIEKFPGYNSRKLFNFQVLSTGSCFKKYYFCEYLRENKNIFENIFVFAEIFTKVVFFQSNFQETIPGNCTISRYCYPEIFQFLSNNTRKLKILGYCYPEIDSAFLPFGQFPGIVTWKLKIVKFLAIVTRKLTISK